MCDERKTLDEMTWKIDCVINAVPYQDIRSGAFIEKR